MRKARQRAGLGPVPAPIIPVLRELEAEGKITIQDVSYHGLTKKEYLVHRAADGGFMSEDELALVEDTIKFVCERHTAKSISEASHDRRSGISGKIADNSDRLLARLRHLPSH